MIKINVLANFRFGDDKKAFPIPMDTWGCAFSRCPKGQRIKLGDMVYKIEEGGDVDLVHHECYEEMKRLLQKLQDGGAST